MTEHDRHKAEPAGCLSQGLPLFTDLYELTMLEAYLRESLTERAVFSLSVRSLPPSRNFLIACGIGPLIADLEGLRFTESDLAYLDGLGLFGDRFLSWLQSFRFTGDLYAVPEGTTVFPNEPLLEVSAPLPEAQLIETLVLNQIHLQTVIASKAVRVVLAAQGRPVIDFGARRMHGIDAAVKGARAMFVAGVFATSDVFAGKCYGLPVSGTMAHSYIQAHTSEMEAFRAFARLYPATVLLVDTYDTLEGVRRVIAMARELGPDFKVQSIRLDSGDLGALAKGARRLLDEAGLQRVGIFASSGLEEDQIGALLSSGAPIDAFGVGTHMGVATDAPDLDMVYKLCEYAGEGRLKLSTGKPVLPGRKQVYRLSRGTTDVGDVIAGANETLEGRPLLEMMMREGRRTSDPLPLSEIRDYARSQIARLPGHVIANAPAKPPYPVTVSPSLQNLHALLSHQKGG